MWNVKNKNEGVKSENHCTWSKQTQNRLTRMIKSEKLKFATFIIILFFWSKIILFRGNYTFTLCWVPLFKFTLRRRTFSQIPNCLVAERQ